MDVSFAPYAEADALASRENSHLLADSPSDEFLRTLTQDRKEWSVHNQHEDMDRTLVRQAVRERARAAAIAEKAHGELAQLMHTLAVVRDVPQGDISGAWTEDGRITAAAQAERELRDASRQSPDGNNPLAATECSAMQDAQALSDLMAVSEKRMHSEKNDRAVALMFESQDRGSRRRNSAQFITKGEYHDTELGVSSFRVSVVYCTVFNTVSYC